MEHIRCKKCGTKLKEDPSSESLDCTELYCEKCKSWYTYYWVTQELKKDD